MKFDLIVVGGGTSGLRLAVMAANTGYSTALIEKSYIGGTCLNTGCIPTKALLYAAQLYNTFKDSGDFGIKTAKISFDFKKVVEHAQNLVLGGRRDAEKSIRNLSKLKLFRGEAKFISDDTVAVGTKRISGKKIIIATGARASIPPIKGIDKTDYWTNVEALTNTQTLKSIAIIGGGYIAAEFATFFSSFGCKVVIIEILPDILNALDKEAVSLVKENLKNKGVEINTKMKVTEIKQQRNKKYIFARSLDNKSTKKFVVEKVLVATGRVPNSSLDLEKAHVKTDKIGYIKVNRLLQTSNKNVYAIGDVNGMALFSHAAKRQAIILHKNLFKKIQEKINLKIMPYAVFTSPIISGVGLTEEQAKDKGYKTGVLKASFTRVGRAAIINRTEGFVKIIFDKATEKILGCTIVGHEADDIIHEIIAVMNTNKASTEVIKKIIHIHPTLAEVMANLE